MELSGGWLKTPSRIDFEFKYNEWFWVHCEKPFNWRQLEGQALTRFGVELWAKKNGFSVKWIEGDLTQNALCQDALQATK